MSTDKPKKELLIQEGSQLNDQGISIDVHSEGPYEVHGNVKLIQAFIAQNEEGHSDHYELGESYPCEDGSQLCRCGLSQNAPYCDGNHRYARAMERDLFERAQFTPSFDRAKIFDGPRIRLYDEQKLCAFARFCDRGDKIWREVRKDSDEAVELSLEMAHQCPAGRLILVDAESDEVLEPEPPEEPCLYILEDPAKSCSGPLFLQGGIPVHSIEKDRSYEVRNRQTLCRCGHSNNMPFCNAAHIKVRFKDGLAPEAKKEEDE